MEKEDNLKEGLKFGAHKDVDKYVKEWSDANLSPFIIRSSFRGNENSNGRIQYVCPHGVDLNSLTEIVFDAQPLFPNPMQSHPCLAVT